MQGGGGCSMHVCVGRSLSQINVSKEPCLSSITQSELGSGIHHRDARPGQRNEACIGSQARGGRHGAGVELGAHAACEKAEWRAQVPLGWRSLVLSAFCPGCGRR